MIIIIIIIIIIALIINDFLGAINLLLHLYTLHYFDQSFFCFVCVGGGGGGRAKGCK